MSQVSSFTLDPYNQSALVQVSGPCESNLQIIEKRLGVAIVFKGNQVNISGDKQKADAAKAVIVCLYNRACDGKDISKQMIYRMIKQFDAFADQSEHQWGSVKGINIHFHSKNQAEYLQSIIDHDVVFAIGPSGTGKTFLSVVAAVHAYKQKQIRRIVLARPAVEAGEKLGFLPGDLNDKIDPYFRPLYDALYDLMKADEVKHLLDNHVIEVAPLAYMRGRTLNDSFIILDEAQNATQEQMKMFLTRIGYGSKVVVNGDVSQIDLPRGQQSGLNHAIKKLKKIPQIAFCYFDSKDVVRHHIVQKIVEAYEQT